MACYMGIDVSQLSRPQRCTNKGLLMYRNHTFETHPAACVSAGLCSLLLRLVILRLLGAHKALARVADGLDVAAGGGL
jgi:hypothetical protein